jgi:hypothetical protein
MANEIGYKKLKDETWGLSGVNLVPGTTVTVTKKSGETKQEVVGAIVWKNKADGFCFAKIATSSQAQSPAPKAAPRARTSTRGTSTRRSRRSGKKEGVQEGKYSSSREGDEGDEVGRVRYLKSQGVRIPVVVVGYETGYCNEDGLSFGLPMDEGYYTTSWYRDATEEEATDLASREAAKISAKETAARAAKEALEAAEKAARAPLEGLIRSDSLATPKGTRTSVGNFKNDYSQNVSVTKIELEDGRVVYHEGVYMYDDSRDYIWATQEVLASLYEERLAEHPISLEEAQEYLTKYSGCCGADIYKYVVARTTI